MFNYIVVREFRYSNANVFEILVERIFECCRSSETYTQGGQSSDADRNCLAVNALNLVFIWSRRSPLVSSATATKSLRWWPVGSASLFAALAAILDRQTMLN
jgi:hypothetical protein